VRRLDRLRGGTVEARDGLNLDELSAMVAQARAMGLVNTTWSSSPVEMIDGSFASFARSALKSNGVVFAVMLSRLMLFTEARFQWQSMAKGRPGNLFGTADLSVLETPWPNGTTGDLLARMEQDATLTGNWYGVRRGDQIRRLRPDWVSIVLGSPSGDPEDLDAAPAGYIYSVPGRRPITLAAEHVAHYAPIPDPDAMYRGMAWLTPIIREIQADTGASTHKLKFFENAATPNMAVSLDKAVSVQQFREFVREMDEQHRGAANAYKTLYLAGGADVTVVGASMKELDFKATQGAGETRICAAGGVPPIIVGLSEGLASATYSNYGMARRKFGDHWARPSWRQAAGALQTIVKPPDGARLWYDDRDISFLQEDRRDDAEIAQAEASTVETLIRAGFEPDSVVLAVTAGDFTLLQHTGLSSVQLQQPSV